MTQRFGLDLRELADEAAQVHTTGAGLPVARIGARARRARRRHEAAVLAGAGALVAAVALGGAALLGGRTTTPPAGPPSDGAAPTGSTTATATDGAPSPTGGPDDGAPPVPDGAPLGPSDVAGLMLDPADVSGAIAGLGELTVFDEAPGWGLDPDVQVRPSDACRRAFTVVEEAPAHVETSMWTSDVGHVTQQVLLLDDAAAAAAEMDALRATLRACPEFGASTPGIGGASYVMDVLGDGAGPLPSIRAAGTESGEGLVNSVVQVDVLVRNALVRVQVLRYGAPDDPVPATAEDAAALDGLLQALLARPDVG